MDDFKYWLLYRYPHQADGKRSSNVIEWNIIQNIGSRNKDELFLKNGKN